MTGQDALIVEGVRSGKFIVAGNIHQDASAMTRALAVYPDCDLADASLIALSERRPQVHVRHFGQNRFGGEIRAGEFLEQILGPLMVGIVFVPRGDQGAGIQNGFHWWRCL